MRTYGRRRFNASHDTIERKKKIIPAESLLIIVIVRNVYGADLSSVSCSRENSAAAFFEFQWLPRHNGWVDKE